jgi:hypothetical protein
MMEEARSLVKAGNNAAAAIEILNEILLVPTEFQQEAHELIIEAYELTKQFKKAKIESQLYLSLYPNSQAAQRIKYKLIALEIAAPAAPPVDRTKPNVSKTGSERKVDGSVSTYLTSSDSIVRLTTNIRARGFFREDNRQLTIVFRATDRENFHNLTNNQHNVRIFSAEYEDTLDRYSIKIGRQSSINASTGQFDGVLVKYRLQEDLTGSLSAGTPESSFMRKRFFGASLEKKIDDSSYIDMYVNRQTVDGFTERDAIGFEYRSFKAGRILTSISEFDTIYSRLNFILVQYSFPLGNTTIYTLADIRRSPILTADKALNMGLDTQLLRQFSNIREIRQSFSDNDIVNYVRDHTPIVSTFVIGSSTTLAPNLIGYLGTQFSSMSSVNNQPGDARITLDAHLFVSKIMSADSTGIFMTSISSSSNTKSVYGAFVLNETFGEIRTEGVLRFEHHSTANISSSSSTISVKASKKINDDISIEGQASISNMHAIDRLALLNSKKTSVSYFIGARKEF